MMFLSSLLIVNMVLECAYKCFILYHYNYACINTYILILNNYLIKTNEGIISY